MTLLIPLNSSLTTGLGDGRVQIVVNSDSTLGYKLDGADTVHPFKPQFTSFTVILYLSCGDDRGTAYTIIKVPEGCTSISMPTITHGAAFNETSVYKNGSLAWGGQWTYENNMQTVSAGTVAVTEGDEIKIYLYRRYTSTVTLPVTFS